MKNNEWIKGAVLLGLSFFIAILLVKPIGVSTEFSVLAGRLHYAFDRMIITEDETSKTGYRSSNAYYDQGEGKIAKMIAEPLNYSMVFVLSIPLGAWIGYQTTKRRRKQEQLEKEKMEDEISENKSECNTCKMNLGASKGTGLMKQYLPMFIGGFLLLFGARFAGGCTSGHMMSGMMQSSVSGFVFAGVVFAVAIPTARLVKKIR